MRIAFVTSEAFPYAKTGGLADVAGALPKALTQLGEECVLFLPMYPGIDAEATGLSFEVKLGRHKAPAQVFVAPNPFPAYFIKNDGFFNRPGLYGTEKADYPDNLERFAFFVRAALEAAIRLGLGPDILHLHDWQAALAAPHLRAHPRKALKDTKTILTIHNLGYQGVFAKDKFELLNLPADYYGVQGMEFYDQINLLKGGLVYADFLTTVSPTYAQEIQTSEYGCGLDGVLRERATLLRGILNGIDTDVWNPARDRHIYYNYRDPKDKPINKLQLKKELGLEPGEGPIIGVVSRLAGQKGVDLLCDAFTTLLEWGFQIVILGTGDEKYQITLSELATRFAGHVSLNLKFDEQLAHRIYSGADFFLMPSRYEPCGLGQMIALIYSTIPVVRKTGGLADSVFEFDPGSGLGNGFLFQDYKTGALLAALKRAREVYDNPNLWATLLANSKKCDFSWTRAAREYQTLYRQLLQTKNQ